MAPAGAKNRHGRCKAGNFGGTGVGGDFRGEERAIGEAAGGDDRGRFTAAFDLMDRWFNEPQFRGCIFINIAAEFPDPADPVHQAAAAYKREQRDAWRDLAARLGAADAEAFADQFAVLIEGTLVLRHVHGRNDAARVTRPIAEALVDRHVPKGK